MASRSRIWSQAFLTAPPLRSAPELAAVAEVEGRSVSDVAREAIAALVEARRRDQRFRRLLEDNLARHQRLLDLLRADQP